MVDYILFVFEGAKTEETVINSLNPHFISKNEDVVIYASYQTDIYKLYEEVKDDEFLDIFEIIKEKNETLKDFERHMFSQIYLFFDYDGHAHHAEDGKITHLLDFFNEESENGKMFISYPMVEAIKNINSQNDFNMETFKISDLTNFKKYVADSSEKKYIHFNLYSKKQWIDVIKIHCNKANYLLNEVDDFPSEIIEQNTIFKAQQDKHISHGNVSILSGFPLMLLDYFGSEKLQKLLSDD